MIETAQKGRNKQRAIGFFVGMAFTALSVFVYQTCSSGYFLDVPNFREIKIEQANIVVRRELKGCTREVLLSRDSETYMFDLKCCLSFSDDFVPTNDGTRLYFSTSCKGGWSSEIHFLNLPSKMDALVSVREEIMLKDTEIEKILKNSRAWPTDVIDISPDGNLLLINISYDIQSNSYPNRPYVFNIEERTLFQIEPEIAEQTLPGDN